MITVTAVSTQSPCRTVNSLTTLFLPFGAREPDLKLPILMSALPEQPYGEIQEGRRTMIASEPFVLG